MVDPRDDDRRFVAEDRELDAALARYEDEVLDERSEVRVDLWQEVKVSGGRELRARGEERGDLPLLYSLRDPRASWRGF